MSRLAAISLEDGRLFTPGEDRSSPYSFSNYRQFGKPREEPVMNR